MAAVKCPYCGARNDRGATRCRICTAMIGPPGASSTPALPPISPPLPELPDPAPVQPAPPAPAPTAPTATPPASPNDPLDVFGKRSVVVPRQSRSLDLGRMLGIGAAVLVVGSLFVFLVSGWGLEDLVWGGPPPEAEWRSFEDPAGRFVVDLPSEPRHESRTERIEDSPLTWIQWTSRAKVPEEGKVTTIISVVILPPELWNLPDDALLGAVLDEVRAAGATVTEEQYSWTGEFNYRTLDATLRDGSTIGRGHLIYTGSAIFVVETESKGRHDSDAHDRIVESFVLLDPDKDSPDEEAETG